MIFDLCIQVLQTLAIAELLMKNQHFSACQLTRKLWQNDADNLKLIYKYVLGPDGSVLFTMLSRLNCLYLAEQFSMVIWNGSLSKQLWSCGNRCTCTDTLNTCRLMKQSICKRNECFCVIAIHYNSRQLFVFFNRVSREQ